MEFFDSSTILIVNDTKEALEELLPKYPSHFSRVIKNEEKDEFQIAQAQAAIKEAFIATSDTKYLFLCGATFRTEAQNALLKVLEEPPLNVVFILIVSSKSSLLPTIYSRVPYKYLKKTIVKDEFELDLLKLDLKTIYNFIKENQKISKKDAIAVVESVLLKINKDKISLNKKELDVFFKSIRLLELNSRPVNVLTHLFLSLLEKK